MGCGSYVLFFAFALYSEFAEASAAKEFSVQCARMAAHVAELGDIEVIPSHLPGSDSVKALEAPSHRSSKGSARQLERSRQFLLSYAAHIPESSPEQLLLMPYVKGVQVQGFDGVVFANSKPLENFVFKDFPANDLESLLIYHIPSRVRAIQNWQTQSQWSRILNEGPNGKRLPIVRVFDLMIVNTEEGFQLRARPTRLIIYADNLDFSEVEPNVAKFQKIIEESGGLVSSIHIFNESRLIVVDKEGAHENYRSSANGETVSVPIIMEEAKN